MNRLESRCRRLLRAYPQPYRTERGEEILATLLDAAPADRSWPAAGEAWSLLTCGLRVRAARNRQLPLVTNLRLAALLAAAMWLGQSLDTYVVFVVYRSGFRLPPLSAAIFAACALVACLAIASAWFWRRSATVVLALAVPVLALASGQAGTGDILVASVVGPALALAALAAGKDRPPRSWLWLPAAFAIAHLPGVLLGPGVGWLPVAFLPIAPALFLGVLGITLLWFAADARPVIAFGIYVEVIYVLTTLEAPYVSAAATAGQGVFIALLAAALAGAALRFRPRAKT